MLIIGIFTAMSFLPIAENYGNKNYYLAHSLKMQHLDQTRNHDSKRIVFIGGSSLSFGLNSQMLSDQLGVEVYNSTVHGGLGVDFSLDEITSRLNPEKDVVVIGYEFNFIEDPYFYSDARIIADYLQQKPFYKQLAFNSRPLRTGLMYAKVVLTNFLYSVQSWKMAYNEIYQADAFDSYGDIFTHLDQPNMGEKAMRIGITDPSEEYVELIEEYLSGFEYYLICPPVFEDDLHEHADELKAFDRFMENHFGESYILKTEHAGISRQDYFEFPLHLNRDGRQNHTEHVLEALQTIQTISTANLRKQ